MSCGIVADGDSPVIGLRSTDSHGTRTASGPSASSDIVENPPLSGPAVSDLHVMTPCAVHRSRGVA